MMHTELDSLTNRLRRALSLPIRARCAELTVLFDRACLLELQNIFTLLVDSIFGPQGTVSWGLRVTKDSTEDFRQLELFLSPCGPVFKVIYALLKEPSAKYDFPVMYLPSKVQQMLESGQMHPFYAELVCVNPQTKRVVSLLLNPFDYYMFHFAYHLINPWHQRSTNVMVSSSPVTTQQVTWNTVYYTLCCDYMLHFFPTKPGTVIQPDIYYNSKRPVHPLQQIQRSPSASKLINMSVLNQSVEDYSFPQNYGRHPRNQIWRTETVLTVFIDMWFNNDQISDSFASSTVPRALQYYELPTSEYMRIVRVLIKQLHAFASSAKADDSHMSELRKMSVPMLQSKFYFFLRNLVHRWPLDGSFRLLLEVWLTYVQPWRYSSDATDLKKPNVETEETITCIDKEHLPFIAENLLVYVVIFQQLLPRFARVDLVSPKMAVMLYRLCKVFNQPNLASYLKEIEQSIENNHSPSQSINSRLLSSTLPPLNPTSNWSTNTSLNTSWNQSLNETFSPPKSSSTFMNSSLGDRKWSAFVKQKILELEGPTFCYKPLFSLPPAPEVFDLVKQIRKSIRTAEQMVENKKQEEENVYGSFFGLFRAFWETPQNTDEFSLNERLKVPEYLSKSAEYLKQMFQISELPEADVDATEPSSASSGFEMCDDFRFLTPAKVRERIKKIKYEGDPDLHPIRSMEIAFLVRMFYQISVQINENFRHKFCHLYYDPSFMGKLSRQFLYAPTTIYKYDKTKPGSPRVSSELPPRVSLRYFGSYNFWTYITMGWIVALACGYNFLVYLLFLMLIIFVYKCIRAALSSPVRYSYPTQGFGNISFNDSF